MPHKPSRDNVLSDLDDVHDPWFAQGIAQLDALLPAFLESVPARLLTDAQLSVAPKVLTQLTASLALRRRELPVRWTSERLLLAASVEPWVDEVGGLPRAVAPSVIAFLLFLDEADLHPAGLSEAMEVHRAVVHLEEALPPEPTVARVGGARVRRARRQGVNLDLGPLPDPWRWHRPRCVLARLLADGELPEVAELAARWMVEEALTQLEVVDRLTPAFLGAGFDPEDPRDSFDRGSFLRLAREQGGPST